MKVKQLIELLQTANPEWEVIMSIDSEGNGYHSLCEVDIDDNYDFDLQEMGIRELTSEDTENGYDEDDVCGEPVVILWP